MLWDVDAVETRHFCKLAGDFVLTPEEPRLDQVVDHIDHKERVAIAAAVNRVGQGSDPS